VKSLMVRLQDFPLAEIRLYDIDEARQNTIAPVVEKVIRDHSQSIKFTVTSDPEVAFQRRAFCLRPDARRPVQNARAG
jgi:maltose-6'-phosphate glucosidase